MFPLAELWWLLQSQKNVWCISDQSQNSQHSSWLCDDRQVKIWSSFSCSAYGNTLVHRGRLFCLWGLVTHPEQFVKELAPWKQDFGVCLISCNVLGHTPTELKVCLFSKAWNTRPLCHGCSEAQDFCVHGIQHPGPCHELELLTAKFWMCWHWNKWGGT